MCVPHRRKHTNSSAEASSAQGAESLNKALLEHSCVHAMTTVAQLSSHSSRVCMHAMPKIFPSWSFAEKACQPLV